MPLENARVRTTTYFYKFKGDRKEIYELLRSGANIDEVTKKYPDALIESKTIEGNLFLVEGVNYMWRFLTGEIGLIPFNRFNCHIGVGNGKTEARADQTGLLGTSKFYKSVDTGYPKISANSLIVRATFEPEEANFEWNEWTVANGNSDAAINLNRKVESLGVKSPTEIVVLEIVLSIS